MKPKIFALYLPQFHETDENNEWWGDGYTDWTAVKKAKPLFAGHYQPRIPQSGNYYDLSDPSTIQWQASIAKDNGISGFCIYHYYSNGKLLMQKPAELLLNNAHIDISYFFSWGNHDFRKNWFNGDRSLLRKQEYGGIKDFENHYRYLKQFFRDSRYLKINNKPVFAIYQVDAIEGYDEMMAVWEKLLIEDGFDGIYVIAMQCRPGAKSTDYIRLRNVEAVMPFEPLNVRSNSCNSSVWYIYKRRIKTVMHRFRNRLSRNNPSPEVYDYKWAAQTIVKEKNDCKKYYCAFPDWDNTPRYQGKGVCFKGSTVEKFTKLMISLINKSINEDSEILFINAWNEWGESAYLEPDEKNGDAYLKAVKNALRICCGENS